MTKYTACVFEIYQNSEKFNRHYCRVTGGEFGWIGASATPVIKLTKELYNIPLNGPGKGKARKKVEARLRSDGLDGLVVREASEIYIVEE